MRAFPSIIAILIATPLTSPFAAGAARDRELQGEDEIAHAPVSDTNDERDLELASISDTDAITTCPPMEDATAMGFQACSGMFECAYGEETCCNQTHPQMVCFCDGTNFVCMASDMCLDPVCVEGVAVEYDQVGPITAPITACTDDAILCPDGSVVSRDPDNNCEMPDCPPIDTATSNSTIGNTNNASGGDGDHIVCALVVTACPDGSLVSPDPNNNCTTPDCPTIIDVPTDVPTDETSGNKGSGGGSNKGGGGGGGGGEKPSNGKGKKGAKAEIEELEEAIDTELNVTEELIEEIEEELEENNGRKKRKYLRAV